MGFVIVLLAFVILFFYCPCPPPHQVLNIFFCFEIFIWLHWVLVETPGIFFAVTGGLPCSGACGMLVPTPDRTLVILCIARGILNYWTTRESPCN